MSDTRMTPDARYPALLLLGPTGSGKTPVGEQIEARGLWGSRCVHFDFGANLRAVVAGHFVDVGPEKVGWATPAGSQAVGNAHPTEFSAEEIGFLRDVLESGALLEDEQFPLAERVLRAFLASKGTDEMTRIVLNGMPRHVGQARAIARLVDVQDVVLLQCSADTVLRRIESNVGGDRAERTDDSPEQVAAKLALFAERTAPLVDHYRREIGTPIHTIPISPETTPQQVVRALAGVHRAD